MRRRTFLKGAAGGAAMAPFGFPKSLLALGAPPQRGVLLCFAASASPVVAEAAKSMVNAVGHPVLQAMGGAGAIKTVDSRRLLHGDARELAYNHLILVGAPDDPLIAAAWQREARLDAGGMYCFGFGHLKGDLGYLESGRNPFLHSQATARAPFETQVVTLSGTSPAGIQLAVQAFLDASLVNGIVAHDGWTRPRTSLLDRDPLPAGLKVPTLAPEHVEGQTRLAYTQAGEDEYRGVLEDTGFAPRAIWRVKYFKPGNWDAQGQAGSWDNYAAGLHRRSYGNTVWLAQFSTPAEASVAAPKIAAAAHLTKSGDEWSGPQPPYANNKYAGEQAVPGTFRMKQASDWVMLTAMQTRFKSATEA
jgi:hypothetical protein